MPYTFSHPLAVVPLRRFGSARLDFAALVIGSMSPDFGYFIGQFETAALAHTLLGTVVICLPAGLVVLGIFNLLRRPLCFVLPEPHRSALMPMATMPCRFSARGLFIAAVSVLLGAWTHIVWDSFTHEHTWTVRRIAFLQEPVRIGNTEVATTHVLQLASTVVGAAGLVLLYHLWLRRQRPAPASEIDGPSDRWRYGLLGTLVAVALTAGAAAAFRMATRFGGHFNFHQFAFWIAIYVPAIFVPMMVMASAAAFAADRRRNTRGIDKVAADVTRH